MSPTCGLLVRTALAAVIGLASATAGAQSVFHRGNTGEPQTLDQHRMTASYEANILRDLYEGLVIYDAAATLKPGAAESWTVSADGTVYTFEIRDDARWSNGDPVTADDFVYSFRRAMDPDTAARYANLLYPVGNAEAVNSGALDPTRLAVEAIDEKTLRIALETPTPYFLGLLAHQIALPAHPATVEAHGDAFSRPETMVSNGAYRLVEWVPNGHILLTRNEAFHAADEVGIDQVYYYPTEDRSAALRAFRAGELHTNNDVPHDQIPWLRENMPDNFRTAPFLGLNYYALNTRNPRLDDPDVRRALSLAIDRDFIVREITGGGEIAAYSFVPPGIANYGDPVVADYRDLPMAERMAEAVELMIEAGYGPDNPVTLEIRFNTSENHRRIALAIADMWAPLGVSVELFNSDVASHYAHLTGGGEFDVARARWVGDYSDPQNFLFLMRGDATVFNYGGYRNPDFDALMDAAARTVDLDERAVLLARAERIFLDDMPNLPIFFYASLNLVADDVTGWQDNIVDVHPTRFLRCCGS